MKQSDKAYQRKCQIIAMWQDDYKALDYHGTDTMKFLEVHLPMKPNPEMYLINFQIDFPEYIWAYDTCYLKWHDQTVVRLHGMKHPRTPDPVFIKNPELGYGI